MDIKDTEEYKSTKNLLNKITMKQETLEEAAKKHVNSENKYNRILSGHSFVEGAEWQAERMYSEEEVYNLLLKLPNFINMSDTQKREEKKEWFEQFKK